MRAAAVPPCSRLVRLSPVGLTCTPPTTLAAAAAAPCRDCFFSCDTTHATGYSGTATYVRSGVALPFAAEDGFTGCAALDTGGAAAAAGAAGACPHPALQEHFEVEELAVGGRGQLSDGGAVVRWSQCACSAVLRPNLTSAPPARPPRSALTSAPPIRPSTRPDLPTPVQAMDSEGRVVVTDHGAFVLFNIYGEWCGWVLWGWVVLRAA